MISEGLAKITNGNHTLYHLHCVCGGKDCSCTMDIEVDREDNLKTLLFYTSMKTKRVSRFKIIWKLLTTGCVEYESDIVLNEETVENLVDVLNEEFNKE